MAGSNSPFSSGGSISSLMKSANSYAQKIADFEDAMAAYQWDNSMKSYSDFSAYSKYLQNRQSSTTDPMGQLTYQKKIDSAHSGYISNEIQRQSIDVIEGSATNTDKYNRMVDLYYRAAGAGQFDLAQGLRLQLDNLSVTIQNEQRAQVASSKEASGRFAQDLDNQVKDAEQAIKDNAAMLIQEFTAVGPEKFMEDYGSDLFSALNNMVNSPDPNNPGLVQIYEQAMGMSPDPSKVRSYQQSFNKIAQGGATGIDLPGLGNVTVKDLQDQAYASSIGQTLFEAVETGNGTAFKKNQVTGYAYGRDETGEYKLMPVYGAQANFDSGIKDEKGNDKSFVGENGILAGAGFEVTGNNTIRNNGELDSAGIARGQQVQVYVGPDGRLQVINGDKSYALNFDEMGKYSGAEEQQANLINLLPTSGDSYLNNINNRYFGAEVQKDPNFFNNMAMGSIATVDGRANYQPGMVLQQGAQKQAQIQEAARIAAIQNAPAPIQMTAPSPQQTISPIGLPNKTQISIVQPKPPPKITVGTAPKQNLTIGTAPKQNLSIGYVSNPRLSF